jgi:hypothetical protein
MAIAIPLGKDFLCLGGFQDCGVLTRLDALMQLLGDAVVG